MKLKNKLLSAGLAACMIVPMAMPVCANGPKSTDLKYEVTSHYKWQIHSKVDFGNDQGLQLGIKGKLSDNAIKVIENVIPEGKRLKITVKGNGDNGTFTIRSAKTSLSYIVRSKSHQKPFDPLEEVFSVPAGENGKTAEMEFILYNYKQSGQTAEFAGNYEGNIIYTASID